MAIETSGTRKGDNIKMAQFKLTRKWFTETTTIGDLHIEGKWKCYILEDTVRDPNNDGVMQPGEKIPGKTAIPYGTYEIIVSYSNKFKKHLPLLLNVENYRGIRLHPGNSHLDTEGCLLPGMEKAENNNAVSYSRKAFNDLHEVLKVMCAHEKVWIEIVNEREPDGN